MTVVVVVVTLLTFADWDSAAFVRLVGLMGVDEAVVSRSSVMALN